MQLTSKVIEHILGFSEPKTKIYELPLIIYQLNDNIKDFKGSVEFEADEKTMQTFWKTHQELIFDSALNEV